MVRFLPWRLASYSAASAAATSVSLSPSRDAATPTLAVVCTVSSRSIRGIQRRDRRPHALADRVGSDEIGGGQDQRHLLAIPGRRVGFARVLAHDPSNRLEHDVALLVAEGR
jgi:hypothetical protein